MAKLVLFLYFLNGEMITVEDYTTKGRCSEVLQNLGDVRNMYQADGIIGMCLHPKIPQDQSA
jgi:hypothetical protein